MKKVFKIIGACFLMCGVIALIVCMCAIPNETKEFFNVVFDYLDRPIVLCGVSVTLGGILGYFIVRYVLSNTSYGKKHLNELEEKLGQEQNKTTQMKMVFDKALNKLEEEINNVKKDNNTYCEKLEGAIKQVPNKKVQEALNNGK